MVINSTSAVEVSIQEVFPVLSESSASAIRGMIIDTSRTDIAVSSFFIVNSSSFIDDGRTKTYEVYSIHLPGNKVTGSFGLFISITDIKLLL
tara:strand:+ start:728 stop:1003 length:276 start_codon:yes stop_codon:yes gene_type:complete